MCWYSHDCYPTPAALQAEAPLCGDAWRQAAGTPGRNIFIHIRMISLGIFGIEPVVFAVVALLTGVALVGLALWIAKLISPRSYNPQKGEAYECGIPTRGESMAQFKVGYYLYAILFLMFDVETVFLYPWAVNMHTLGTDGLLCIAVFFGILVLGLVYAWRKGALEWK